MKPNKEFLYQLYVVDNLSTRQIAALCKVSKTQVSRWLNHYNINLRAKSFNRKIKIDESVFDKISDEGAYWIGFLISDGCVRLNKDKGNYNLKISLCVDDKPHLEKLKSFLKSEHQLFYEKPSGYGTNGKGCFTLSIYSKRIFYKISEYGIKPKKSLNAKVNLLSDNCHFWRGAVDGDGWITFNNDKPEIGLTGSFLMVKQFEKYIKSFCPTKANIKPNNSVWSFVIVGNNAKMVISKLYSGDIFLDRKMVMKEKALAWQHL